MDQLVKIPWKAWYGDEQLTLSFPDDWKITICAMDNAPELTDRQIEEAFETPIDTPRLRELAKGSKNAAIVMDDITRNKGGSDPDTSLCSHSQRRTLNLGANYIRIT